MAWAGLTNLSVDANGDSVFNGANEKLTITFSTSDFGGENQKYTYEVLVDNHVGYISKGDISKNQTVSLQWDGKVVKGEVRGSDGESSTIREQLPDGDYTIRVKLTPDPPPPQTAPILVETDDEQVETVVQPVELVLELTADVTIDTKAPEITIDIGFNFNEFSPDLYSLPVYYSIDEDVSKSWLLFQRSPGDASTGRPIPLNISSGSHTYQWKGDDYGSRTFDDGKYTLRLRVIDKGGNEVISSKTEEITIDTEKPRITGITLNDSLSLVNGMFTNASIQRISFSADAGEGTPLDPSGADTEISIRPVGGKDIKGALTYGNQPTFALENPLDDLQENGEYEVTVIIADRVGNLSSDSVKFTFDNVPPIIKTVATNRGELSSGTGVNGRTNYVEVELEDNIQLNLAGSSIRLIGPDGSRIVGQQSQHADGKIRWNLLSPLLAEDGLQDGQYTIEIIGKDKAENDTSTIQISFLFDNLAPKLVSLKPSRDGDPFNFLGDTVYYNSPINQFVATFSDGEFGTGVVFTGAENSRIVFGIPKEDGDLDIREGRAFPDINNDVLTYILNTPLIKTDGSQDGEYVINVTATDKLGNTETYPHRFVFDTQLPTLSSTVPAANQTVSNLSEVVIKLNEVTSGIDFTQSNFQLKRSDGENQVEVPVNIQTNGTDTATLTPLQPIALDGSDDGTYTIEITPTDLAGNSGAVVRRQFYLVSQTQPKIRLTTPETGTVSSLGDITVEIENYIGSGINFDDSTITVSDVQGIAVPQSKVEADEANNQLTWSTEAVIPRNGTADGEYTVSVVFVDFSGQSYTQQFSLVLDTQFPGINTVSVGTDPPLNLSINTTTDISEAFSQITVGFDSQDIDFENTVVTLTGPGATEIASHRSDDGNTHLTLEFQNLAQLGTYTLSVIPIDRIGNVSTTPFVYRFQLDIDVPVVTSVLIGGQIGAVVYVNGSDDEIIATLTDSTGTGLALGEGESRIVVTTESGLPVPGITTSKGVNQLIWRPIALPTDGSADGQYIVAITPVDKAGRTGNVVFRSFIFDTQLPRISASSPVTLHQPISYIGGSLSQFQFTVEDIGPALLDLDAQTIGLQKKDGEAVSGHITHDGINQIFYTLSAPLPTNGSADGEYTLTVNLVDQAGNSYQVEHDIFYDSQAPSLSSVSLSTDTPLELTPYQVINLSESISQLTLNFVEMTRVDFANTVIDLIGPGGSSIPLSLENNGVDQLTVSFVSLTQGGLYTLSVTPQDIAGNVAQGATQYPFQLEFDVPGISSVIANTADTSIELVQHEIIQITESINSLVLSFTDASRIDFENTQVMLTDINGEEIPITKEKNVDTELVVRFVSLTQSGLYMLTVTPQDRSGNTAQTAIPYQFRLDIALPTVSSVLIDGKSSSTIYVNDTDFSIIATFIEPTGVGLAFGDDESNIVVTNANGLIIQGITESNGSDQLNWSTTALPSDGSADGRYTVSITPIDNAGRTGKVVNQEFIYDTQAPRITSSSPATLHQPISNIGGSLTQLQFAIEDIGPASFDIDSQIIGLNQMDGEPVEGEITHDGTNQLFFTLSNPLPTDGSADGKYTLNITLVDKAGNVYQTEHDIFYDSQAPQISSVSLSTETPMELVPYEVANLSETINEVSLIFTESTGVDFSNTTVTLMGPENSVIPLTLKNNGVDQITASFVSLTQSGLYTLSITPQDITGNVSQGATQYPFQLEFEVPGLSSVAANTTDGSVELISYKTVDIFESVSSFTLVFTDSSRIDFENTGVSLTGDNGQEIPVSLETDATHLNVRFVSLTQSGMYTLSITPQDILGNTAQGAVLYPFHLKFVVPGLSSVAANTDVGSVELTSYEAVDISESINSFTLVFTDSNRIDFENTSVTLTGGNGQEIPISLEVDANRLNVRFVSLTQSGMYTLSITPQDISGNTAQGAVLYPFRLKFEVPGLSSVAANTDVGSVELISYETVDIFESVSSFTLVFTDSSRIDFENTGVSLTGDNGQEIPVSLETDATHLYVRFVSLTQSGMYTLSITPQDILGNTAQGAVLYPFHLKFVVPGLSSVAANTDVGSVVLTSYEAVDISESINSFTLVFTDSNRIDFENTSVSLTGGNGQEIPISLEVDANRLNVRFVSLTQSGMYTLSITPQDISGNTAQGAVLYPFRLKFEVPGLSSVAANTDVGSVELISYETVDIFESVSSFTLVFTDSSRIDFENTGVSLTGDNGQEIPVSMETDATHLYVRFVSLTQGGMYTLSITPQDIAGNAAQGSVIYPFQLKFQVSAIASVKATTEKTSVELIQHDVTEFSDSVNALTLEFIDASQIDFENTNILLTGPNEEGIAVTTEEDEASQLVVRFVPLMQSGVYTLSVTPQDITGNIAKNATQYQFRLVFPLPSVSSVLIDGKPGSTVYVSKSIPIIIATFSDNNGIALSLEDDGSTIVVKNSEGMLVSGVTTSNGSDQLTWRATPLPTDGSADGTYAVTITPVDKSGRTGTVVNQQFIYDSQAPRITSATPLTIHAPVSYIGGGLSQFVINIEDVGPSGIDLASQVAALQDSSGDSILATLTYDEIAGQLYLTLTQPFANDGSMDGIYTLNVLLIDKAGNRLNSRYKIIYDSKMPQVSSVTANTVGNPTELVQNQVTDISESISTIIIKFAEATLVDFTNTTVSLLDPDDATIPINLENDGVSQLTLNFVGLTQIGQYTLTLIPQDVAGNTAQNPIQYSFILEFILPEIESIVIGDTVTLGSGDIAYVNADNLRIIANLLDPAETGLSFDVTTGSNILVATLDNIIVRGSTATNGTDLLVWEPITLSTDGSSDGRYAVYVTPVDKKGRSGNTGYREFIYDTQEPEITSASPINLSQPVSYISDSLTQLSFTLQDVGPADIILDDQKVSLRNQSGALISTQLTHDSNNQLYLTLDESLPLDGSRDGEYTVVTDFSDKAGNVLALEHPIIYDTQAPTLVSTVPANGAQLTEDITQIQVNLNDRGDSGIDWTLTTVTLVDPNGDTISGELTSNGRTQLTLRTNQLVADGRYEIRVQAVDRAGNGSNSVFENSFLLSRRLPAVLSTLPVTAPAEEAYTNEEVDQVEVRLETTDDNHLSTLRLLNADGQVVAGQQQRSSGRLVYTLIRPLATDGSEDGIYTIEFTPISASGRSGEVQQLTFTYDTQVPEIESEAITLVVSEPEVNNSLIEIKVAITDNQSGIDWENLDEDWINFERVSPNATEIEGRVSFDEQNNLIFRLTVPLADNGSADGKYRIEVTPVDQAGNGEETYEKVFTYDTSPPVIDPNSLLLNDLPLLTDITAEDYPSAISTTGGVVVQASVTDTGLGVNLSQSKIIITNPNGQEVSGTTHQNGVDTIIFKSDGLPIEGIYQVNVTGIGNDSELLGFAPKGSITTEFLYETTEPSGVVTDDGGKTELTDAPIPFQGTATDPQGVRRVPPQQGDGEIPIPASGVWLVEIVGTGPDGQPIEPVPAVDESDAQEQPWSRWTADFLPTRSGEYDLDLRVTDKAGNFAVYDIGEYTMSVSFSFSGNTFGWPNPLRHSKSDVAFFSFDLNAAAEENIELVLYIYDWGGDLVYSKTYTDIIPGERSDTHIKWNLENQSGTPVARGLYVFRLEAVNGAGNRANAVGKILVVD